MKIAVIAPPWLPVPPVSYGGTEAVIDRLARGYAAAGHEVLLCATADSTCPVPRHSFYRAAQSDELGAILPGLCHVIDAYHAVAGADIVHDHTFLGPLVHPAASPPVVVTNHGPFEREHEAVFRAMAGRADVVAISAAQAATAPAGVVHHVIRHGIDVERCPVGRGDGGYLAFLGRMAPTKGVDAAIDIARAAGVPLRIAAKAREPKELAYLDEVVRPRLGGEVEYLGEITGEEKAELLGGAMALLNPIRWCEPFGLVMIEALAAGTPVIARRLGAAPEIVEHGTTGFLGNSDAELTEAIGRLGLIDRSRCREAARTAFSTRRMVEEYLAVFEEVLVRAKTPAIELSPAS